MTREDFNYPNDGERFERLKHALDRNPMVEEVDLKPGGALDAARIHLKQYTGTVPESVVSEVYDQGLAIRNVGGYKQVGVSAPEYRGGALDAEQEREVSDR